MMEILKQHHDDKKVDICVDYLYVMACDTKKIKILQMFKTSTMERIWSWVDTKTRVINYSEDPNGTFNDMINMAVNDMYCTVYQLEDFNEMIKEWKKIKYVDQGITIYEGKQEF